MRDTFKLMMRDEIAPRLRELGFKGSGVYYSLPHPTLYRLMHFQISGGTRPHTLDFTVNLSLINVVEYEEQWEPWMPKKPTEDQAFDVVRLIGEYVVPELARGNMRGSSMNRQPYAD